MRTLVYGRESGKGRNTTWVQKIVSFRVLVCTSGRDSTGMCQSRLGSAKSSVQFIIGTDCVMNRKVIISVSRLGELSSDNYSQLMSLSTTDVSVECRHMILPGSNLRNNYRSKQAILFCSDVEGYRLNTFCHTRNNSERLH